MRIKSFSFESEDWVLQKIDLQEVNLLVGKNGTGKSKTLSHLGYFSLIEHFFENIFYHKYLKRVSKWDIEWITESNTTFRYTLKIDFQFISAFEIIEEELLRNESIVFSRKGEEICKIYSEISNSFEEFTPPSDKLGILSRRDTKSFPYIEEIINWSKNSRKLSFSEISQESNDYYDFNPEKESFPLIFSKLNTLEQKNVTHNFQKIGFSISEIIYQVVRNQHYLLIRENGLKNDIYIDDLSQGMLRALNLLIYVEYLISKNKTATLLIDDLGEGLDYVRATALGKMLFQLCKENNIQLVATSNDSFLMDVIDIDYWNVLERNGKVVSAINIINNPKLFEDFRYTGLSNFDFFSSSYLPSRL
jgi:energy-coupling factor transporter ATP-binding protein EcfA2